MPVLGDLFGSVKVTTAAYDCHEIKHPWTQKVTAHSDVHFILAVKDSIFITAEKYPKGLELLTGDMFVIFDQESYRIHSTENSIDGVVVTGCFNLNSIETNPLLSVLPDSLHLSLDKINSHAMRSMFELMATESGSGNLGAQAITDRICEIFFIQVIRNYSLTQKKNNTGWLAGLFDDNLKEVIKEIHLHLEIQWTVERMAVIAGMSRSAFALRFKNVIGKSPLEYLTSWRVYKASILLKKNGSTVAEVAHAVGYESASAFNRVFKQRMGKTPGEFKKMKLLILLMFYSFLIVTDTFAFV